MLEGKDKAEGKNDNSISFIIPFTRMKLQIKFSLFSQYISSSRESETLDKTVQSYLILNKIALERYKCNNDGKCNNNQSVLVNIASFTTNHSDLFSTPLTAENPLIQLVFICRTSHRCCSNAPRSINYTFIRQQLQFTMRLKGY